MLRAKAALYYGRVLRRSRRWVRLERTSLLSPNRQLTGPCFCYSKSGLNPGTFVPATMSAFITLLPGKSLPLTSLPAIHFLKDLIGAAFACIGSCFVLWHIYQRCVKNDRRVSIRSDVRHNGRRALSGCCVISNLRVNGSNSLSCLVYCLQAHL